MEENKKNQKSLNCDIRTTDPPTSIFGVGLLVVAFVLTFVVPEYAIYAFMGGTIVFIYWLLKLSTFYYKNVEANAIKIDALEKQIQELKNKNK